MQCIDDLGRDLARQTGLESMVMWVPGLVVRAVNVTADVRLCASQCLSQNGQVPVPKWTCISIQAKPARRAQASDLR